MVLHAGQQTPASDQGPGGRVDDRAYSVGVWPYCFLKARMKWLLSANCQWAASSERVGRPYGAVRASRASSSRRRRTYEVTDSPAAANARCNVRTDTLSSRASIVGESSGSARYLSARSFAAWARE